MHFNSLWLCDVPMQEFAFPIDHALAHTKPQTMRIKFFSQLTSKIRLRNRYMLDMKTSQKHWKEQKKAKTIPTNDLGSQLELIMCRHVEFSFCTFFFSGEIHIFHPSILCKLFLFHIFLESEQCPVFFKGFFCCFLVFNWIARLHPFLFCLLLLSFLFLTTAY